VKNNEFDFSDIADDEIITIRREPSPYTHLKNEIIDSLPNALCIALYVYVNREDKRVTHKDLSQILNITEEEIEEAFKNLIEKGICSLVHEE
jgi:predicted HTH transcriptional regulator